MFFAYRSITFYGSTFQLIRLNIRFLTPRLATHGSQVRPRNPGGTTRARLAYQPVWAVSRSLAATKEIDVSFSS